tara:strand:+ start:360 stop:1379 length:1020 start_codon:yes stop_codon:yes gene_type:complete
MTEILDKYIIVFITVAVYNFLIITNFSKISMFYDLFDIPDKKRKIHKVPVSLLGGFIIFSNFLIINLFLFYVGKLDEFEKYLYIYSYKNLIVLFTIIISIFLLGYFDDKYSINPLKKLFLLSLLMLIYCINNPLSLIDQFYLPIKNLEISFKQLSLIFSVSCYVFLIIALNMFDGINLQSFSFFFINLLFLLINLPVINPILIILIFSLVFFAFLNFRNKCFLGDSGSYILSFILGYFYVKAHNNLGIYNSIDIVNFLFLPIIDSFRVIMIRQSQNKSVFLPDKIHIHHYLLKKIKYEKTIIILSTFFLLPHILFFIDINSFIILLIQMILYSLLLKKI